MRAASELRVDGQKPQQRDADAPQHAGIGLVLRASLPAADGKKLDMGKSCLHFRKLDDLPLDVIAETVGMVSVDEFIAQYEKSRQRK